MSMTKGSSLVKLMNKLRKKIDEGKDLNYAVPDLWNCFGYPEEQILTTKEGLLYVNPYHFYYSCIQDYIMKNYDKKLNYAQSLSLLTDNFKVKYGYLGGDWIKESTIYSMHIRTSTSWDHDDSGKLEEEDKFGLKDTGTFVKSIALLPLLKKMGITAIYLLPISTYSTKFKKGELGSPYSVKNYFKLDSNLKDPMTDDDLTVEEEFRAFVEAAHILGIRVMIDLIPRTASRDSDLILEHPDWFYWIKKDDLQYYKPPTVEGLPPAEKPTFENIHLIYRSPEVWEHIRRFCPSPDVYAPEKWKSIKERCKKDPSLDFFDLIEEEIGLTTAPAFADCINDPQPPWTDVTYVKLYLDDPVASQKYTAGKGLAPYILFDTIKNNMFKGQRRNEELWNTLADIIPYYQEQFGIDGARLDMGHALPSELVEMILDRPRKLDRDFAFIAEELQTEAGEEARKNSYNMIIGFGWWLQPRISKFKTHEFMYEAVNYKAPVFACAETADTPRLAARDGGKVLSKFLTIMNHFVPNAVPFINSGLEIYETQPMNTGLDCKPDERLRLPKDDPYYDKLAFFDKYQLHWTNPDRWDLPDTLEIVSNIRRQYLKTIANPENFVPVHFESPKVPAIGLAWMIDGRRWKTHDNVLLVVGNTDLDNEREYVLYLENIRRQSGNASRKAWLMYSPYEWNHDIYDFDDHWNLHLKFKPGEVKILLI
jgi:starch synthase (maltosyl-transferring)